MDGATMEGALAAADVLTSFESYQHLVRHRAMAAAPAKSVLVDSLTVILSPSR
jgi:hypothetical protein